MNELYGLQLPTIGPKCKAVLISLLMSTYLNGEPATIVRKLRYFEASFMVGVRHPSLYFTGQSAVFENKSAEIHFLTPIISCIVQKCMRKA